jgi:putative membrane protein
MEPKEILPIINGWAVVLVWLFHSTAIIGISFGHVDWFIEKTPLNLCLSLLLFLFVYPVNSLKKGGAFLFFFIVGMFAEWLGITTGLLFGDYDYGTNFGIKIAGVPLLIGSYWALLTFITMSITDFLKTNIFIKMVLAASLMVFLDFFMEASAARFNFWEFLGNEPPLLNYISCFLLGLLFQGILRLLKINGDKVFSLNLYLAQFSFFFYFYFYF